MFIVIFPITLLNGAYTGSMVEVSNTLGVLSEDITMAYYSASVGMAVAYPIVPKIRTIATPKTLLLTDCCYRYSSAWYAPKPVYGRHHGMQFLYGISQSLSMLVVLSSYVT